MIIFSSVSLDLYGNYDRLCVKLHANGRKSLILMANSTHSLQQLQYQEILWCFMMQQQENTFYWEQRYIWSFTTAVL